MLIIIALPVLSPLGDHSGDHFIFSRFLFNLAIQYLRSII